MANLNKVFLMGRLTADPELRHTQSNLPVTSFSLAVNKRTKPGEQAQASFIDVVCWRNTAEFVSKYFTKGQMMLVIGSLQTRSWKDNSGNNRKAVEVVAEEVQFAEPKRDGSQRSDSNYGSEPGFDTSDSTDFVEISSDDDLPF